MTWSLIGVEFNESILGFKASRGGGAQSVKSDWLWV